MMINKNSNNKCSNLRYASPSNTGNMKSPYSLIPLKISNPIVINTNANEVIKHQIGWALPYHIKQENAPTDLPTHKYRGGSFLVKFPSSKMTLAHVKSSKDKIKQSPSKNKN